MKFQVNGPLGFSSRCFQTGLFPLTTRLCLTSCCCFYFVLPVVLSCIIKQLLRFDWLKNTQVYYSLITFPKLKVPRVKRNQISFITLFKQSRKDEPLSCRAAINVFTLLTKLHQERPTRFLLALQTQECVEGFVVL